MLLQTRAMNKAVFTLGTLFAVGLIALVAAITIVKWGDFPAEKPVDATEHNVGHDAKDASGSHDHALAFVAAAAA
jgi:hypothetical protein